MTGPSAGRTRRTARRRTARRRTAGRTAGRRTALPHGADDEPSGRQRSLQRRSDGIPVAPQLTRLRHQFRLFRLGYHAFRPQFRSGIHRSSSLPSLPPLSPSPLSLPSLFLIPIRLFASSIHTLGSIHLGSVSGWG